MFGVSLAAAIASAALVKTEVSFSTGMPPLSQTIANNSVSCTAPLHGLPGERRKTKPLGAALALKATGTALHHRPEAFDDRTRPTLAQINFAYPPRPAGPGPSRDWLKVKNPDSPAREHFARLRRRSELAVGRLGRSAPSAHQFAVLLSDKLQMCSPIFAAGLAS
jgi:hypothetical protein